MRASVSDAAVAFALANLYLLYLTGPLVSPAHQLVFHLPGPATPLFAAALADVLALTLLLATALFWVRSHPRLQLLLWTAILLPLPAVLLGTVAGFSGRPANLWLMTACIGSSAAIFSFTLARLSALVPSFRRRQPAFTTFFLLLSCAGLLLFGQLLWNLWQTRHLNGPFVARASSPGQITTSTAQRNQPRVVWVILDELSYRQIFSNRPANLVLPNFDRLAATSIVLTQTQAAANYTRIAVPSLLTGLPLVSTVPTGDGQHLLLHPIHSPWRPLNPADTVFADVAHTGLPTGVAGWYEPYCRLLPGVLDSCFWTYRDDLPEGLSTNASLLANTLAPLRNVAQAVGAAAELAHPGTREADPAGQLDVARHAADYRDLYAAGDRLLHAQQAGLLLLHMPIPHPWGFYDRHTGRFPAHRTSYLDNLALADLYLGHLRQLMEADGTWDHTTLLLMGDHGWRTHAVWRTSGFWTSEEERASHGGTLVDRPAVYIKLPGQRTSVRLDRPFAAFRTRALINAVCTGELKTPIELARWVEQAPQ